METKFIEQLVTTAPESLREITHTLRVDVEALLKAKSTKNFLCWNLTPITRSCAAISCGRWNNCPNFLRYHAGRYEVNPESWI